MKGLSLPASQVGEGGARPEQAGSGQSGRAPGAGKEKPAEAGHILN